MKNFFHAARDPETTFKYSNNNKTWLFLIWKIELTNLKLC